MLGEVNEMLHLLSTEYEGDIKFPLQHNEFRLFLHLLFNVKNGGSSYNAVSFSV